MLLVVDCGNTNTVLGIFENSCERGLWRISTKASRTPDEYAVWLTQLMALSDLRPPDITGAIVANVVPAARYGLVSFIERYFAVTPMMVGDPGVDLGIEVLIERPEQVGADRLVNAVAAHMRHSGHLLVIDFGTATTFDVLDAEGNYRGSVLAPGIHQSVDALAAAAAQLPRIHVERTERVIGGATVPAMKAGVFWGYVSMIDGLVRRIKAEYGHKMTVIATGGLAPLFKEESETIDIVESDVTVRGLVEVYRRNAGSTG